jgi:hypothetical protein
MSIAYLQSIDDVQAGNSLSLGMLGVGNSITNDRFEERFEDATSLFVDHSLCYLSTRANTDSLYSAHRDTLDTSTTGQSTNSRLGDTLNVVSKNLAMALGTTLAEALATFTTCFS